MKVIQSVAVDNSIWRDFLTHPGYSLLLERVQAVANNYASRFNSSGATNEVDKIWRAYGENNAAQEILTYLKGLPSKPA